MKTLLILLASLLLAVVAEAQVSCVQIGQFLSCDGPRGRNTTQLDLGNGMGVITDQGGNVEPYAILPPKTTRPGLPTAPRLPESPRAPVAPYLPYGQPDPLSAPEFQAPIFVPYSFGGEGQ